MSINQIVLSGNLGSEPKGRLTENGNTFATLSIATNEKYKNAKGEFVTKTYWNTILANGRVAEIAEKLNIGTRVLVIGKLIDSKWKDKQGVEHLSKQIIASQIHNLSQKVVMDVADNDEPLVLLDEDEGNVEPVHRSKAVSRGASSTNQRTQGSYRKAHAR